MSGFANSREMAAAPPPRVPSPGPSAQRAAAVQAAAHARDADDLAGLLEVLGLVPS